MNREYRGRDFAVAGAVFALVLLLFIRTAGFEFVNMDDSYYVVGHEVVEQGLTRAGVHYAFTSVSEGNYLPLTWLSHMLVVEFGGTGPAAHHVANVLLHALSAGFLYLFLTGATGYRGRSLAVSALWAVHPLRVESVAWVAERKDVLSGLFFVLTLMAYVWYARRPGIARYGVVAVALALGLLAKSILMIVPCVLLLLDAWPLERVRWTEPGLGRRVGRLMGEKMPLVLLAAAAGIAAIWSQGSAGALSTIESLSLPHRVWNALASCATYLVQTVWPFGLGVYYPYRDNAALYLWGSAGLLALAGITAIALYLIRIRPYLAVGWFWFLGALAPVIGLVQAGIQAHADRYTYLPHMGLFAAAVWAAAELFDRRPNLARWRIPVVVGVMTASVLLTWRQTGFWRDSERLFGHTLAVTGPNHFAEGNYGVALLDSGRPEEAEKHFLRAIEIGPATHLDYHNLAASRKLLGKTEEARDLLETSVRIDPEYRPSWVLLGDVNVTLRNAKEALEAYREARRLGEKSPHFHTNTGIALGMEGRLAEAEAEFQSALRISPDYVPALFNMGVLAVERGHIRQARELFERALSLAPDYEAARTALAALDQPQA